MLLTFNDKLNYILETITKIAPKAAVGIVQDHDRWLLGLAKNGDDRNGKWVCPGGHIKQGEGTIRAAVREVREETGIKSKAVGEPFTLPTKPDVAFVHCKVTSSGQNLDPNGEFAALGFFTEREMRSLKLYHNVKKLIDRVKRNR